MVARIYKPSKTAMSSGAAKTHEWVLEFEPETPRTIEPLMGYTSSRDTTRQVKLSFKTREEAIGYAEREGLAYRVFEPSEKKRPVISYSDNFRSDRRAPWTH